MKILEYHYNQSYKNIVNDGDHHTKNYEDNSLECLKLSNMFKKKQVLDLVEKGGSKHKSHNKSSIVPIDQGIDGLKNPKDSLKRPCFDQSFEKSMKPLNANLLHSNLTLTSSISETKSEAQNGTELPSVPDNDININGASGMGCANLNKDKGLSASIANILFKTESNKDQTKKNLSSIERNSLSMMVSYHNGREEVETQDGHDNPSFEKTSPVRDTEGNESLSNRLTTKL